MRTPKDYYVNLNNILDEIFGEFEYLEWTFADLAKKAGVTLQTIHNLCNRKTKYPHFRTVYLLAKAMNMNFTLLKTKQMNKKAG